MINDFKVFLMIFSAELWCIVDLTAILRLFENENSICPQPTAFIVA